MKRKLVLRISMLLVFGVCPQFGAEAQKDLHGGLSYQVAIAPVVITANTAVSSSIIDMINLGALEFVIQAGTLADSNATFAVTVAYGDDVNSESAPTSITDSEAVPDSSLIGTEAAASFQYDDDNEVFKIGFIKSKRWVRLTITPSGNSGNAPVSVVAVGRPLIRQ